MIHSNLLEASKVAPLDGMDVILCRNVISYFDLEAKKRVIKTFHDKLVPGGSLFLGHSDSLINVASEFELKHLERDLIYRRPVPGEEHEDPWHALARTALEKAEREGRDR